MNNYFFFLKFYHSKTKMITKINENDNTFYDCYSTQFVNNHIGLILKRTKMITKLTKMITLFMIIIVRKL